MSGDLLEEYRDARYPAVGALRADAWYLEQVFSMVWRLLWPCLLVMVGLELFQHVVRLSWNASLVQTPAVSILDALVYLSCGYYGSQRTGLIRTGAATAGVTSMVGVGTVLGVFTIEMPSLLMAPFEKPFIWVILSLLFLIAMSCGIVLGALGGVVGRWMPPAPRRAARVS